MVFIIMAIFGVICAAIGGSKGRSAVGWFLIGFFFGLFGLIMALVMSDLGAEEERHRRLERDNHRLREQVRKERMVSNQRHSEVQRRLAAHDRVLDLDTNARGDEEALLEHDEEARDDDGAIDDDLPPRTPRQTDRRPPPRRPLS